MGGDEQMPETAVGSSGAAADSAALLTLDAALAEYRTAIRDTTRLNRLFAILSEPAPLETVVDRVLLALSELFAADVVALLQSAGPAALSPVGAIGLPEDSIGRLFSGAEDGYPAAAVAGRAPILVENGLQDPRMDPQLKELGVETATWLPVLGSREVMGVLVLGRCQPLPFARSDADMLMAMTHRVGLVLERSRAEDERKRLQARLSQLEKSESLGRMAAAIAHHFNNKLTAVLGSLDLALDDIATGNDPRVEIAHAQEATRQASMVSQLMLAYLGQSFHVRDTLDLVATCRDALPDLVRELPPNVHLRADLPDRAVMVRASGLDLVQVISNLVVNAGEAAAGMEGEVVVAVREVPSAEVVPSPLLSPGWAPRHGPYACLEVTDSGIGMDGPTLQNAFDPFFTTKFTGRGLGLPVVLGIVRAHDGTVSVTSQPGRGSTFRVFLPLWIPPPALPARDQSAPDRPQRPA
jgi:signal transduction histidine kinase